VPKKGNHSRKGIASTLVQWGGLQKQAKLTYRDHIGEKRREDQNHPYEAYRIRL
jgi:hypothetical protein